MKVRPHLMGGGARTPNNEKKDAHHWIYIEFASRRAHGNNVEARRDFFLVNVSCHRILRRSTK